MVKPNHRSCWYDHCTEICKSAYTRNCPLPKPQRVKQISVDLDRASLLHLLRVAFSWPYAVSTVCSLPLEDVRAIPVEVTVSPSGVGFHFKIQKEVTVEEDLKIRALLWDHADRLVYALKKWALNKKEEYVDLVFDEKNEGIERHLPLDEILKPREKEVKTINELLDKGENEKADEAIKKLAKAVEPQVTGYKRPCFVGCIAFKGDDIREPLEKICTGIAEKDSTFSWKLYPCWFPEFDWILAVFADDKQRAWKRITWLKNRAKQDDTLILKDADTRLFVKERTST